MTDRPIIFSAPMVRALLEGRKTQTRRLIKPAPQPFLVDGAPCEVALEHVEGDPWPRIRLGRVITAQEVRYRVGMRLWVRENCWAQHNGVDGDGVRYPADGGFIRAASSAAAVDAWDRLNCYAHSRHPDNATDSGQLVPSIHMPRWASRLTLTVTDVRVQKARDISREDALAEGVRWWDCQEGYSVNDDGSFYHGGDPREAWWQFFSYLHRPRTSTGDISDYLEGRPEWDPEVVALSFTVEQRNIDA